MELEPSDLDFVRDETFEGSQNCTEKSEEQSPHGEIVVAVGREDDSNYDGHERSVGAERVSLLEESSGEDDGKKRGHAANDLMERNCD